jgi:hypothetical protein
MSDHGQGGGSNPNWGMAGQPQQPPHAQPMAPPHQPYGGQPGYGAPPPGYYPPPKSNKGLIITLVSVIGVLVLTGIVLLIVWLSGGFDGSSRSFSNSGTTTSTTTSTGSYAGASTAVSGDWLQGGYWKEQCSSNSAIYFGGGSTAILSVYDNGRNSMGTYSLSGNTVTMSEPGRQAYLTVERLGQNQMRATLNGRSKVLVRCTGSATNAYPMQ